MDNTFPTAKHLLWNNHESHITMAFRDLLLQKSLTDVSIVCGDKKLLAHKILLSAASPFFHRVFEDNPCKHPIIILNDYPSWVIELILAFIYCGEVHIPQEAIYFFVEVAKDLEIKGLNFLNEIKSPQISPSQQPRRKQTKPNRLPEQENLFDGVSVAPLDFSIKSNGSSATTDIDELHMNEPCMKKQKQNNGDLVSGSVHEMYTVEKSVEEVVTPVVIKKPKVTVKENKQRGKSTDKDLLNLPYPTLKRK